MSTRLSLPLLDQVRIASPCPAKWSEMEGDAVRRHCRQCDLDVHNLSAMTRVEAEAVLQRLATGRVCARFYRRADGTILTRDCPTGVALARRRLLQGMSRMAAAVGLAVLAGSMAKAAQDKAWGNWGWSIRLRQLPVVERLGERAWSLLVRYAPAHAPFRGGHFLGSLSEFPSAPVTGLPMGPHGLEF